MERKIGIEEDYPVIDTIHLFSSIFSPSSIKPRYKAREKLKAKIGGRAEVACNFVARPQRR